MWQTGLILPVRPVFSHNPEPPALAGGVFNVLIWNQES